MWDLNSLTRDQTGAPWSGSMESYTTGPPEKSLANTIIWCFVLGCNQSIKFIYPNLDLGFGFFFFLDLKFQNTWATHICQFENFSTILSTIFLITIFLPLTMPLCCLTDFSSWLFQLSCPLSSPVLPLPVPVNGPSCSSQNPKVSPFILQTLTPAISKSSGPYPKGNVKPPPIPSSGGQEHHFTRLSKSPSTRQPEGPSKSRTYTMHFIQSCI